MKNIKLAMRRIISHGCTAHGDRVTLIKFGHTNVCALYKNGEETHTFFDPAAARKMWLSTILEEV